MGYKKSFNLVTIQIIIPLSTMTKAEYKNTYGIDLDDIDIEKVTLLQEDGSKNKYFVDEVKTTENGVDIYAGGKILSIGSSSVSVISGVYSVSNAKLIYCHPLTIGNSIDVVTCLIFNNDPTPFTSGTFADWIIGLFNEIGDVIRVMASGAFMYASNLYISSFIAVNSNGILFYGLKGSDGTPVNMQIGDKNNFVTYATTFIDGVNKIN